ncbi:MAG TPA: adenylate/guanylate cyclase domain-containing protein [Chthoniobacterales bacterium]|jgi:adenylate cyclase|nr:adenylate/guanylate cyclase domain-containing protein [Chthoniobacterales bacterium]
MMAGSSPGPNSVREQIWLRSPWPLLVVICAAAALWTAVAGNPFESVEMRWFGQVLRWRYERGLAPPADPGLVHVDITQADLRKVPTLELEYQNAANIIRQAFELGAKVVAFDVVFGRGNEAMAGPILKEIEASKTQSRSVILAEALLPGPESGEERVRSFPFRERVVPAGLINVRADGDGVLRRYDYVHRNGAGETEPSLALACYLAWRDIAWPGGVTFPAQGVARWEELSSDFTSVEPRELKLETVLLNYRSPWTGQGPAAFRHYNVAQLEALHATSRANGTQPLTNAIVIVSYYGAGLGDMGTTSIAPNQPRVVLHSTALNDLIQRSWLKRTPRWLDALAIIGLIMLGAVAAFIRGTVPLLLFWFAGVAVCCGLSIWFILKTGWVPGLMSTGIIWSLLTFVELGRRQSHEFIQRLKLRSTMSLYFSPHIMEQVLKNPGSMEPQQAEITVLLTDLRNSTPIAELLGPPGMFRLLNQVFETQTQAILAEDGSMEHFLGDQFLSYWGAPQAQVDAADRAYRAALSLISGMEALQGNLEPNLKALFGYGVALHSGSALIGNKGSAQRLDYGLVGDLINAAARVESLTKYYGVLFLMTREAFTRLSQPPSFRVIDRAVVKGTSQPLELIEVKHPFSPAKFDDIADRYRNAFAEYERGDFEQAQRLFSDLAEEERDKPSALMAERCRELAETRPSDWRGVYHLTAK